MTDVREQLQRTLSGTYTLERELGGGGMSRVFVARDTTLERPVVVKVLSPELAAGVSAERFTRETKVAASLQQANIVPVLAAGVTVDGLPYYTMPFVEGQSLRSRLAKGGAVSISECIGIMRDVAKALAYAHERGIVHRDIKPDNVLLSGGTAVVTDFGIAKAISAARTDSGSGTLTQLGTAIGTPAYMSPEQAAGDPNIDRRADIYSLGCLMYELLAGQAPFHGKTPAKMMAAHMGEEPAPVTQHRPDTPATLAELVMRCLAKDVDARPQSGTELVHALDSVTSGGTSPGLPAILIGGPGMLKKALAIWAAAFGGVAILAQAAIVVIGLPDWVMGGAMIVMALGLPVILFTAYVARLNRQIATLTPTFTPGGSPSVTHGTIATLALKATPHVSWKRTAMGGAYALAGFSFLVGGFMTLRALGIGPAGSLLAAGKITAKQPIIVTDFKVTNADTSLGRVLGDATRTTLAESKAITLATPEAVAGALRRMQRPVTSTLLFPLARELAMRNNVKAIVDGEVTGLGSAGFIVTLKLVTTDSVRELASFRETAGDARGLIDAVDKLSRSLRARVGESLRSVRQTLPLFDATTSSLDALRKFTEGSRIAELEGNNAKAEVLLREAVAIDSTFASGWRKLAIVLSNGGRGRVRVDSALSRAYKFRDRLSDSEQDFVVAGYFGNGPGRDRARAIAAYESMLRRGDTSGAANNAALLLVQRREFARAESLYMAQERDCPGCFRPMYGNLALAQARLQKLNASDSTLEAGLARFPDAVGLRQGMIGNRYLRGDTAGYRRALDSITTKGDSAGRAYARVRLSLLAARDGRFSEWRKVLYANRPEPSKATPQQRIGWILNGNDNFVKIYIEGRARELEREMDVALAPLKMNSLSLVDRFDLALVTWYARAGRPDKARTWLATYDAEVKDTAFLRESSNDRARALAEVLLAERKPDEALREFRAGDRMADGPDGACDICYYNNLARAFDQAEQVDSAIVYYERIVGQYAWDRWNLDWFWQPTYSKRLGELYEQQGNREKAAKYYRDFVTFWRNPDPALRLQVDEVRRRLSRMADIEQKR